MIGIRGRVVFVNVTRIAIEWQRRVLIVGMARGALHACVSAGERELSLTVIKRRAGPIGRRMAQRTILREGRGGVRRSSGCVVLLSVAGEAGSTLRRVGRYGVARRALYRRMFAGERELGGVVVKSGAQPVCRGVAALARLGESGSRVVGAGGCVKFLGMAGETGRWLR